MKTRLAFIMLTAIAMASSGCAGEIVEPEPPVVEPPAEPPAEPPVESPAEAAAVPAEFQAGERLYNQFCAECHGVSGTGTDQGPPHVDKVYEPSHHPDASFRAAVSMGVRSHHWSFGDMEPIEGIADEDVEAITAYVRWLQREAGIE